MNKTLAEQFDANAAELLAQHNLMNAVYAVLIIIFVGILFYLFRLDRKLSCHVSTDSSAKRFLCDSLRFNSCCSRF